LQALRYFECTSGWEWLRSLARLQELSLSRYALDAVPPLAPLPSCTALDLSCNQIARWRHLAPLVPQLQALQLYRCDLNAVPSALSRRSRLTLLDLSSNPLKNGGWGRLAPLTVLVELKRP
jgi:Leucine-rich repeat (LRR) protein